MDLLLNNPQYFFQTYFAFSKRGFVVAFGSFAIIMYLLCGRRFKSRLFHTFYILLSSVYLATVVSLTLFNINAGKTGELNLNPLSNIQAMLGADGADQIRSVTLNIMLFIPAGMFASLFFIENKFRNSMIFAASFALVIEVLQFATQKGCAETMDLLCYLLGAAVGALVTIAVTKNIDYLNNRYKMQR